MKKSVKSSQESSDILRRPPINPEIRENQLISLAIDLAEKQLREGTASSQVITHYLKLGSSREKLEKEIMEKQAELMTAKKENLEAIKEYKQLYQDAVQAMKHYSGDFSDEQELPDVIEYPNF